MNAVDLFIQNYFTSTRTPTVTEFFGILTSIFDLSPTFFLVLFFLVFIMYKAKGLKYSILFLSTILSAIFIVYVLKNIFDTSRPLGGVVYAYGGSFPSYHATIGAVFFVMLMYIFHGSFKSRLAMIFNIFSVSFIILVALSRVYLGVHWLTDVVVGVVLGLAISHGAILVFRKYFKDL
ncbi:MAG: Phosphatase [Parcubacteria bacterium C7867-003]|nr:MAG: Phosphatase [Parcubacteria bacterium C7867-003]